MTVTGQLQSFIGTTVCLSSAKFERKPQSNMDASTCLKSVIPDISNSSISILFERVLPSLVSGLLFGGIPPYIIHISNLNFEFEKGKLLSLIFQ